MATLVGTISNYYDAASTTPDRDWGSPAIRHEDHILTSPVRYVMVARMRKLLRNSGMLDALLHGAARSIGSSTARSTSSDKHFNKLHDLLYYRWCKRPEETGLSQRQAEFVAWIEKFLCGEVFWVLKANGKYRLVTSEFCGSPGEGALPNELNGIVYNEIGAPIAYRFGSQTTSGGIEYPKGDDGIIPAEYVIHDVRRDRVSQGRGVPYAISVMSIAKDLDECVKATVKKLKSQGQAFAAVTKNGGPESAREVFGTVPIGPRGLEGPGPSAPSETDSSDEDEREINLVDGSVILLEPGEKIELLKTEYGATDFRQLVITLAQLMSAPLGIPVELWFTGLADTSFSGYKGIATLWEDNRREYINTFIDTVLERLHFWRAAKWVKEGDILRPDGTKYVGHPDGDFDLVQFRFGRAPVLDRERLAKANAIRLASGEITPMDLWEEEGEWEDEVIEKRKQRWFKLQVASGKIKADTDPDSIEYPISWLLYGKLPGEAAPTVVINEPQQDVGATSRVDAKA